MLFASNMILRQLFGGFAVYIFLTVCVFCCKGIPQLFFTAEPSGVTARQGESILLACAAYGEQPINVTWRRGAEQLHDQLGAVQLLPNGSLRLHLGGVRCGAGERCDLYQCCASNSVGTLCSRQVSVVVTAAPSKPLVLPQDQEVTHNASARLLCQSRPPEQHPVLWLKNGVKLEANDRYTLLPDGVLQITPVVQEDEGEYQCVTGNPATPVTTSDSARITVVARVDADASNETSGPREKMLILAGPSDARLNRPVNKMVLECLAAGSWVDIQWSRSDERSLPAGRSQFHGLKNLELTDLTPDDSGIYTCQATDARLGEVSRASASLEVTDYHPPQFTERPTSSEVIYFATARLYCRAVGNPRPKITWYLNGQLLASTRLVHHDASSNNLVIWNMDRENGGIYQCFATNAVGTVQSSALLTVQIPKNRPNPPFNLSTLTISSSEIQISWLAPENVTFFSLHYYAEPDGEEAQHVLENSLKEHAKKYIVTSLHPFTNYTFFLRSFTSKPSRSSEKVLGQTAEGVPLSAPVFSLMSNSANTIIVSWNRLTDLALTRGPISRYRICYRESRVQREYMCREVSSSETTFKIQGLKARTVYDVYMAMSTSIGFGPESDLQVVKTTETGNCSVPLAFPLATATVLDDTEVGLMWSEPSADDNSSVPVLGFNLHISGVTDTNGVNLPADTHSYVVSDLLPNSRYTIRLTAYNKCGMGPASSQTLTMPSISGEGSSYPPPANIRATALNASSIQLNWDPVLAAPHPYYKVIYRQNSANSSEAKEAYRTNTYVVLRKLKPFTIYVMQVRVHLIGDIGEYSQQVFCRTQEDVPSAPVNFRANPLDPHTVGVAWRPPLNPNGVINAYNIMYTYVPDTRLGESMGAPSWNKTLKKGTDTSSTIKNLTSNTTYYFVLRACTSVGEGQPSTVLKVRTPQEINFRVETDTQGNPDGPSDIEKGSFIGIILGSICIFLCTMMAAIKYKKCQAEHKQKMATRVVGIHASRVPVSRLANGGGSVEMELTALSPMLAFREPLDPVRPPNSQITCESPILGLSHSTDPNRYDEIRRGRGPDRGEGSSTPAGNGQVDLQQQHHRHTLPCMGDGRVSPLAVGYAPPGCSTSLPESGSEDGAEGSRRWTPLRESTSGDSGLVGDMEFPMEETSPDFIEKVLRECHIGIHPV